MFNFVSGKYPLLMMNEPVWKLELGNLVRPTSVTADETKMGTIAKLAPGADLSTPHQFASSQEVFWDDDEDPLNPLNWSKNKKWAQILLVTLLTFVTSLSPSLFAPAVPDVMREFHNDEGSLELFVVSVFVLGYAAGSLVIAPLSELYGRVLIYHVTSVLFIGSTAGCAMSQSVGMMIAFRFLSGFFGVGPLAIGGGTISDLIASDALGMPMALWGQGSLIPPVIAPVAGGYLTEYLGWRWCFWIVAIPMGLVTIVSFACLHETYGPVILKRKADKLNKKHGAQVFQSRLAATKSNPSLIIAIALTRPITLLLTSLVVAALAFYTAVVYGYEYFIFTTLAYVFQEQYDFSTGLTGLTYLGTGLGTVTGVIVVGAAADKFDAIRKASGKDPRPELALWPLCPASILIPIAILWYGWSVEKHANPAIPIVGLGFFGFAMMAVLLPVNMFMVKAFDLHAASAILASVILRNTIGAVLPLAGHGLYDAVGYGWGNSVLAFISIALAPIPFGLIYFGPRLRHMDRHLKERKDPRAGTFRTST